MNIGTVVEGPTDRIILEAILNHLIPGEHNYLPLQPKPTFGEIGTGWKGVRRWCRQTWQLKGYSLEKIFNSDLNSPLDMLVIHVDADIADEHDLQEENDEIINDMHLPCPPIEDTVNQLRCVIKDWLKCDEYPRNVILAIPAQDTENWVFVALFPENDLCVQDDYECIKTHNTKPSYLLSLKEYGKLTQRKNGKIKKHVKRYRKETNRIADKWDTVCRICSQAYNFDKAIKDFTEKYDLKENLETIQHRIQEAAIRCNRKPETIRLVAVSKTVPADRVREVIEAGVMILGENYIQEAQQKIDELSSFPVSWHFIGHLQSNKAKYAVKLFDLIHSVDSLKLAQELDRQAKKINKVQHILIQVNIGEEISKSGTTIEELQSLVKDISKLESLSVKGLMIIPPFYDKPEKVRPYFSKLRELRDQIREQEIPNIKMDELSMGMTGDFEAAIEEGATLVRIGTAIFGRR